MLLSIYLHFSYLNFSVIKLLCKKGDNRYKITVQSIVLMFKM